MVSDEKKACRCTGQAFIYSRMRFECWQAVRSACRNSSGIAVATALLSLLSLLPACSSGNYCRGDTGTAAEHFHPCEPTLEGGLCQIRCADGYRCTSGCAGDASQRVGGTSQFKCTNNSMDRGPLPLLWKPYHPYRSPGWLPLVCEKEAP